MPPFDTPSPDTPELVQGLSAALDAGLVMADDPFRQAFEQAGVGMLVVDLDGRLLRVNRAVCELLGYQPEEVLGRSFQMFQYATDADGLEQFQQLMTGKAARVQSERQFRHKAGHEVWVQVNAALIYDRDGSGAYLVGQVHSITDRKRAELQLKESEQRFRTLTAQASFGVFETDPAGNCIYVNERWCQITGQPSERAAGDGWSDTVHPDDRQHILATWRETAAQGREFALEFRYYRPDGSTVWVLGTAAALRDSRGKITGYLGNLIDITERKQGEAQLRALNSQLARLASFDGLTGLLNRRSLLVGFEQMWLSATDGQEPIACIILDLDHFKLVNDCHGHAAGDEVLKHVGAVLQGAQRSQDLCGRWGGEEFLIVCGNTTIDEAEQLAEQIRNLISLQPVAWRDVRLPVTMSLGVAQRGGGCYEPHDLIARADEQLYTAKRLGRNRTCAAPLETDEEMDASARQTDTDFRPTNK